MSNNYDNSSDSSHPQPKKTVDESRLNSSQAKKTVVEPSFSHSQPKKTVDESRLNTPQAKKTVVEPHPHKPQRTPFTRKDPLEGKTIGDNNRYLLQTLLGQGGMSKVYRALDTKFEDRVVAIKLTTNYSAASGKHLIKRFMGEVKAISRLKHPNIIQIFDFGVTPDRAPFSGSPFYVMEYFDGKTLQNLLSENKTVSLDSLANIIRQVCAGLKEAHQKGIVHRDLKPENIFLVAGGAFGEIVKILDFGIAKNISADAQKYTQLTQEGSFIGTYRYASPEQCRGLPNIDQRTDIYSLGVILYEAICGQNPYNLDDDFNTSHADWIACHIRVPPKPLKQQPGCEHIKDELENIVMRCLAKSPQDRFADLGELQNALASNLSGRSGVNYNAKIDPKNSNKLEGNTHRLQTTAEVKQIPAKTLVEPTSDNSSQNITPSTNKKLSFGLIAGITTLIIGVLVTGGYLLFNQAEKINQPASSSREIPSDNESPKPPINNKLDLLLENLKTQDRQGNYQDCYQLAIDSPDRDNTAIQEWIGKCGLKLAKIKAQANSYSSAIAIAQKIPNTVPNYQEVKDSIDIWSEKILDYAKTVHQQKGIEEAIKITKIIPENASVKAKIPELILQWQQTDEKYRDLIDRARQALNQKAWFVAKREVEKIPSNFAFWRAKAKPILDQANEGIKNYKPRIPRKNPTPYKPPRPTTPNPPPIIECEDGNILNCR